MLKREKFYGERRMCSFFASRLCGEIEELKKPSNKKHIGLVAYGSTTAW